MKKILLPLLALASLALPARAAIDLEAIAPDGFARGVAFTVNGYEANRSALTNFPVLVRISEAGISGFNYADVYSHTDNGKTVPHLAFTDAEGNALAFDVDTWTNTTSFVWATLPVMTNGTEFAMFWRANEADANAASAGNAFTNYVGVWHLGETGDGTQTIYDSSTNGLVATSSIKSSAKADGQIGGARQITDTREKNAGERGILVTGSSAALAALNRLGTDFIVSFWLRPQGQLNNTNNGNPNQGGIGYDALISRKDASATATWALQFMDSPSKMRMWTCQTVDSQMKQASNISLTRSAWSKMDVVYKAADNGTYILYVDGTQVSTSTGAGVVVQGSLTLDIGGYVGGAERSFLGDMDEVRVGPFTPGADWVKADYDQTISTTFLSTGTTVEFEEAKNPIASFALDDYGAAFAQFSGSITACGGEATACSVYARVYPTGGTAPEWTLLASGLEADDTFSGVLVDLLPQTDYIYEIKAVNNLAEPLDSVVVTGPFTTSGAGEIGSGGDAKRVHDSIVHTFKIARDGTDTYEFVPPSYATSVEALVVGGGGPGGYYAGGGGGAGGLVYDAALPVRNGETFIVTVGAGGAAASSETERGATGGNSLVASGGGAVTNLLAVGGGAGGNGEYNSNDAALRVGADGASGGGGGGRNTKAQSGYSGGSGMNGQGNPGGAGLLEKLVGGGGGGAGGAGAAVSQSGTVGGGGGGIGVEYSISGTPTYYAGGGGGGGKENNKDGAYGYPGSGGRGGGGNGGMYTVANAGTEVCSDGVAGTGGGGGGGATRDGFQQGGNGGSGIVILRYDVKGDGAGMTTPAVALESLDRDKNTGLTTVGYRVAWAGDGYDYADVLVVWGFRKSDLDHTNALSSATGVIGRGTGTFTLPDQLRTVYVRALATNAVAGALSPEIETIPFVNPAAPEATVSVTDTAQHTATFAANVTGLGGGATSVSGVFQVCGDEDFEEGTYLTFPASGTLSDAGTLTGTASGLAFNTAYFVRASLTNNLPEFFETEPVEFRTKVLGTPSGSVQNNETYPVQVGSTTITATVQLWSPGTGATSATIRLEASTDNFATVAASSDEATGLGEREYATLTITGLQPETEYKLRLRMENEGHMVHRSDIVGPFTTLAIPEPTDVMILVW